MLGRRGTTHASSDTHGALPRRLPRRCRGAGVSHACRITVEAISRPRRLELVGLDHDLRLGERESSCRRSTPARADLLPPPSQRRTLRSIAGPRVRLRMTVAASRCCDDGARQTITATLSSADVSEGHDQHAPVGGLPATSRDRRRRRWSARWFGPRESIARCVRKNRWLDRRSSAYDFKAIMTARFDARPTQRTAELRRVAWSSRRVDACRCDRERSVIVRQRHHPRELVELLGDVSGRAVIVEHDARPIATRPAGEGSGPSSARRPFAIRGGRSADAGPRPRSCW